MTHRPINIIAAEIKKDWTKDGKKVYFGAVPYLEAMFSLRDITENYGEDSAESVVAYFLSNAAIWKGEVARSIKKELNLMIKR